MAVCRAPGPGRNTGQSSHLGLCSCLAKDEYLELQRSGNVALLPSRAAAEEWQKAVQHSRGLLNKKQDGA